MEHQGDLVGWQRRVLELSGAGSALIGDFDRTTVYELRSSAGVRESPADGVATSTLI